MNNWVTAVIGFLAFIAAAINSYVAYNAYVLSQDVQKAGIFAQFQQQYDSIASRFPQNSLDKDFHPKHGSIEYKRLQDYWIFCYAEWFATHAAANGAYKDLWSDYYAGLIQNALEIQSLKHVLEEMMRTYGTDKPKMQAFYNEIRNLAHQEGIQLNHH